MFPALKQIDFLLTRRVKYGTVSRRFPVACSETDGSKAAQAPDTCAGLLCDQVSSPLCLPVEVVFAYIVPSCPSPHMFMISHARRGL